MLHKRGIQRHGASPTTGMTHIAIQEHLNGTAAQLDGKG